MNRQIGYCICSTKFWHACGGSGEWKELISYFCCYGHVFYICYIWLFFLANNGTTQIEFHKIYRFTSYKGTMCKTTQKINTWYLAYGEILKGVFCNASYTISEVKKYLVSQKIFCSLSNVIPRSQTVYLWFHLPYINTLLNILWGHPFSSLLPMFQEP